MKTKLSKLVPSRLELVAAFFVTILVVLLANSKQLLSYYGLQSSDQLIKANAGTVVKDGLSRLDGFSATTSVVTFLIWALVGFACFSLIEAVAGGLQELKLQKQVTSKQYIKPANFSSQHFWRSIVVNALTLLTGLVLLSTALFTFIFITLPLSLSYSKVFLFGGSATNIGYMGIGMALVLVNLLLIDSIVRFLMNRRQIIN